MTASTPHRQDDLPTPEEPAPLPTQASGNDTSTSTSTCTCTSTATRTDAASTATAVTRSAAPGLESGERLLTDLRSEIGRADSKASVLVAALGMTAGVFSGLLAGSGWSPSELGPLPAGVWWSGAAALVFSLLALLIAVLPRYRRTARHRGEPLTYFGDIQQAVRDGDLAEALAGTERDPLRAVLLSLGEMSRIATRKHQWIRAGLIAFCLGSLLLPVSVLIG